MDRWLAPLVLVGLLLSGGRSGQQPAPPTAAEVGQRVEELLGGTRPLVHELEDLDKLLSGPPEVLLGQGPDLFDERMGKFANACYPSQMERPLRARAALLALPLSALGEPLCAVLRAEDLSGYGGMTRAWFAVRLLEERTLGSFGFDGGKEPEAVASNRVALASWIELLSEWRPADDGELRQLYQRKSKGGLAFKPIAPVLSPGEERETKLADGTRVAIRAGPGFERAVQWSACDAVIFLEPSDYDRSGDRLGLYNPGLGYSLGGCKGIRRLIVSESRLAASSQGEAAGAAGEARMSAQSFAVGISITLEKLEPD